MVHMIVDPGVMTSVMTSWKLSDIHLRKYGKSSVLSRMVTWPMTSRHRVTS